MFVAISVFIDYQTSSASENLEKAKTEITVKTCYYINFNVGCRVISVRSTCMVLTWGHNIYTKEKLEHYFETENNLKLKDFEL